MSVQFTKGAPTDTADKLSGWVSDTRPLAQVEGIAAAPMVGEGYEVHYVPVDAIAAGNLIDAATVKRWRHLVSRGKTAVGEIELDDDLSPMALYEGPAKDGFGEAMARADALDGDFEAVVLSAPGIRFVGLWLHGNDSDLIMPYAPNLTPLENYVAVPVGAALEVLQPLAARVLENSRDELSGG